MVGVLFIWLATSVMIWGYLGSFEELNQESFGSWTKHRWVRVLMVIGGPLTLITCLLVSAGKFVASFYTDPPHWNGWHE